MARFKGQVTVTGQFLDNFGHHMVNSAILAAIGVAAWRSTGHVEALTLGFAASLAGQRVDLSLAMAQAQQAADKPLDQAYSYFNNSTTTGGGSLLDNLQGQAKKSSSWIRRRAFGFFSYPSIMHWLLFLCIIQLSLRLFSSAQDGMVWLAAAWIYGIFLPLRRALTLRRIVVSRVPDQLFLRIRSPE